MRNNMPTLSATMVTGMLAFGVAPVCAQTTVNQLATCVTYYGLVEEFAQSERAAETKIALQNKNCLPPETHADSLNKVHNMRDVLQLTAYGEGSGSGLSKDQVDAQIAQRRQSMMAEVGNTLSVQTMMHLRGGYAAFCNEIDQTIAKNLTNTTGENHVRPRQ
jgi:hypothetical protein